LAGEESLQLFFLPLPLATDELPRCFADFTLNELRRFFASLRMTSEALRMTANGLSMTAL
jgi:hypothetical protein